MRGVAICPYCVSESLWISSEVGDDISQMLNGGRADMRAVLLEPRFVEHPHLGSALRRKRMERLRFRQAYIWQRRCCRRGTQPLKHIAAGEIWNFVATVEI
jgi:hypothetical protein